MELLGLAIKPSDEESDGYFLVQQDRCPQAGKGSPTKKQKQFGAEEMPAIATKINVRVRHRLLEAVEAAARGAAPRHRQQ